MEGRLGGGMAHYDPYSNNAPLERPSRSKTTSFIPEERIDDPQHICYYYDRAKDGVMDDDDDQSTANWSQQELIRHDIRQRRRRRRKLPGLGLLKPKHQSLLSLKQSSDETSSTTNTTKDGDEESILRVKKISATLAPGSLLQLNLKPSTPRRQPGASLQRPAQRMTPAITTDVSRHVTSIQRIAPHHRSTPPSSATPPVQRSTRFQPSAVTPPPVQRSPPRQYYHHHRSTPPYYRNDILKPPTPPRSVRFVPDDVSSVPWDQRWDERNASRHSILKPSRFGHPAEKYLYDDEEPRACYEHTECFMESVAAIVIQTCVRRFLAVHTVIRMILQEEEEEEEEQRMSQGRMPLERGKSQHAHQPRIVHQQDHRVNHSRHDYNTDYDMELLHLAARIIQSVYFRYKQNTNAAVTIQRAFRGYWVRDCLTIDHYCATTLQALGRGYLVRLMVWPLQTRRSSTRRVRDMWNERAKHGAPPSPVLRYG